jgi:demethylphylloquinone reductase
MAEPPGASCSLSHSRHVLVTSMIDSKTMLYFRRTSHDVSKISMVLILLWSAASVQAFRTTPSSCVPILAPHRVSRNWFPIPATATTTSTKPSPTALNAAMSDRSRSTTTTTTVVQSFDRCDVAVFGGGFGGLYTALAISREAQRRRRKGTGKKQRQLPPLDVALVDPSDRFVFLPLLYDLTMGTATEREVCPLYADLLEGTGVRHIRATLDGFSNNINNNGGGSGGANDDDDIDDDLTAAFLSAAGDDQKDDNGNGVDGTISTSKLSFDACVVSVGATPESIMASVPGAARYAQPFYTREDAWATRDVLFRMDQRIREGGVATSTPRVAVVGGGYGGVELAACLARRLPDARVTLVTRGPPMGGTRAEPLIDQALQRLGVAVEMGTVRKIEPWNDGDDDDGADPISSGIGTCRLRMERSGPDGEAIVSDSEQPWDAIFWTAGSAPASPVPENVARLAVTESGRVQVDDTLRCSWRENATTTVMSKGEKKPLAWALGDCSEIVSSGNSGGDGQPTVPRTAQAAMQQADVVAANVICALEGEEGRERRFQFQDLGSVLSLGGPNGAYIGPNDKSQLGPFVTPLLDTARVGLNLADRLFAEIIRSPIVDRKGIVAPTIESLGLSLGGYGLGVDPETSSGTLSGTLSGAARRAIYAVRMPTNRQRAYAAASAAISSATALAKDAADQVQRAESR